MADYEQRIKALEEKVKILEETLETLKNMQMSEQMQGYIKAKTRTLKMAELINSISDRPELDLSKEENAVKEIEAKKKYIDNEIADAIKIRNDYSDNCVTDMQFFKYEIETGKYYYNDGKDESSIDALQPYIGNGIRITEYNGFEKTVIIPKVIDGLPVVSIGCDAFKNAYSSEIILPTSLKAILRFAFSSCKNIKRIYLHEGIEYIGPYCFSCSGLETIEFPNSLKTIGRICPGCENLKQIIIPEKVDRVDGSAFEIKNKKKKTLECAFYGCKTTVSNGLLEKNVKTIYCLSGSEIQKYAREYNIPTKPLSEFKSEE